MRAKLKDDYRWDVITVLGGVELVKSEFRPIQDSQIAQAKTLEFVELEEDVATEENLIGEANVTEHAKVLIIEHSLNPADITGTGKNGAIRKGDVEAYLKMLEATTEQE